MLTLLLLTGVAVHLAPVIPGAQARAPQLAAGPSLVALAYGEGKAIYFTASHDRGRTFSTPVKVVEAAVLPLSRHRGPRIALSRNTIIITAVAGSAPDVGPHAHGLPSDGDLLVWRSTDDGRTWSAGKPINDVRGSASEGLHALAADGTGVLLAVWLDKRDPKGTEVYASRSTDEGATWSKNVALYRSPDGSVCQCCHPSAVLAPDGRALVMWRNALGGARDMYLATSQDGLKFSTPVKLGDGTWQINACPMDGGGLAASRETTLTAWRRESSIFVAEPGRPERRVGTGKDVAVALNGRSEYAAWSNGAKVEFWHDGAVSLLSPAGAFPTLCSLPSGGVLAAWEENGGIGVQRLP